MAVFIFISFLISLSLTTLCILHVPLLWSIVAIVSLIIGVSKMLLIPTELAEKKVLFISDGN